MSSLIIDIIIWILLVIGAGFGVISLIGLLLFPDTNSRMYTSVRASLISIGATGLAVIAYGLNAWQTTGGIQYSTLVIKTIILVMILAIGNYLVSSTILTKTKFTPCNPAQKGQEQNTANKK